jgi:hypothetical protein
MSSVLLGESPSRQGHAAAAPAAPPASPPGAPSSAGAGPRNNTPTAIAGIGVLLLAMGVGVLIGRSGASKQSPAAPQVITVASSAPATGAATTPTTEASFSSNWPSGKSGYTVQLQTLPQSGTAVSAVESAKSAASARGAKTVGALKSEEFSSLSAGSYVIYSGVDNKKPEAEKALAGLEKSFPGAKVVKVANSGSSSTAEPPTTSPGGVGESESHPAPPSVLKSLKSVKGKSYEERSKNLPDVVED